MNLNALRERLDEERRGLVRSRETIEVLPRVTRLRIGDFRLIAYSALDETTAERAITEEIEHHRRLDAAFEWKVYSHDRPGDLVARLERAGFRIGEREAVMVHDLAEPPNWLADRPLGVSVEEVDSLERLDEYREVVEAAFGEPAPAGHLDELARAIASGSTESRVFLAYVDGRPAAAGRLHTHPQSVFAGLYGGGVRPEFRGRGVYRALVSERTRLAIESGARCLLVDALPTSRPILERLGFERLTETWPCDWEPGRERS